LNEASESYRVLLVEGDPTILDFKYQSRPIEFIRR
jgi:hypothetical protein